MRRVLELRAGGAQAATKKIDAVLARAGADDRIRGAFRYHGASTGRWAGEGFQPQNLKRPVEKDLDAAFAAVSTGDYQHMKKLYEKPLSVVGDCTRQMITAAEGHKLVGADLSAIESRVLAWVGGEEWKLEAYRNFDLTQDPRFEPYCVTACRIFGVPDGTYTKADTAERKVGKTCDLAFGYMGGLGAWRKFKPDRGHRRRGRDVQERMALGASTDREVLVRRRQRRRESGSRARRRFPRWSGDL